jgi:integrase
VVRPAPEVAARDKYVVETHILPALGSLEVSNLSTTRLRRWHEGLANQRRRARTGHGEAQRHREPDLSPEGIRARRATANRILTVLKAALNRAFQEGRSATDEAWRRVRPFRGADAARVRYLSEDECRRLLSACAPDLRLLVRAALVSGARYGELSRVEVNDFDPDARALRIRQAKGGRPRWVPLDDEAAAFLERLAAGRPHDERLFLQSSGRPWGKSEQQRPLRAACAAARFNPSASFHLLRHTWASHRVMRGMPLVAVAAVLGHAGTRMVEVHYVHMTPGYVHQLVRDTALDLGPLEPGAVMPLQGRQ